MNKSAQSKQMSERLILQCFTELCSAEIYLLFELPSPERWKLTPHHFVFFSIKTIDTCVCI